MASPRKARGNRKLTNLDRRNICLYQASHSTLKQDLIAERFEVERSTVSKILKNRDHWLAIEITDDDIRNSKSFVPSPPPSGMTGPLASPALSSTPFSSPVKASFHQTPVTQPSVYGQRAGTPAKKITGGRYPELDNELASWARGVAESGAFLSDDVLQSTALRLSETVKGCEGFRASAKWLEGFKSRAGILSGTFEDMLSPNTATRIKQESENEAAERQRNLEEDDSGDSEPAEDDDDDEDFGGSRRTSRKTKRRAPSPFKKPQNLALRVTSAVELERAVSPTSRMDVDGTTPLRIGLTESSFDDDATPTHSTTHSRNSSKYNDRATYGQSIYDFTPGTAAQAAVEAAQGLGLNPALTSRSHAPHATIPNLPNYDPTTSLPPQYAYGYSAMTHSQPSSASSSYTSVHDAYVLQSPFQSHSPVPFAGYAMGHSQAEISPSTVPPGAYPHHGRSGSTASTTSSLSGLTAFSSSQSGTPLTSSLYSSSYTQSQSNPNSVPSTPATGYFSHGTDGTQSQLLASFLVQQNTAPTPSNPQPTVTTSAPPTRRATISGGAPFKGTPGRTTMGRQLSRQSQMQSTAPASIASPLQSSTGSAIGGGLNTLEQALAAIQHTLEYLSHDGQGIVSPGDLVALSDIKGKLTSARGKPGFHLASSSSSSSGGAGPSSHPLALSSSSTGGPASQPMSASASGGMAYHITQQHQKAQRLKLSRTQSTGGIAPAHPGLASRRSQSSNSLLTVFDQPLQESSGR